MLDMFGMYGGFRMSGWWIGGLGMYGGFRMSGWWIGGKSSVSQQNWSQLQRDTQHSKNGYFLVTLLDMLVMVCTSLPFTSLRPLPPPRSDVWAARGVPLAARGGGVPLASRRERSARSRSARSAMVPIVLCWRTAEPNWAKNYALGDQCNEANSIPCSCILFDTIPASTCVFGPLQTRFYQWVHIRLFSNQRTSVLVCIPSDLNPHIYGARPWSQTCPIRNTELERAFGGIKYQLYPSLPVVTKQNVQPNEIK